MSVLEELDGLCELISLGNFVSREGRFSKKTSHGRMFTTSRNYRKNVPHTSSPPTGFFQLFGQMFS